MLLTSDNSLSPQSFVGFVLLKMGEPAAAAPPVNAHGNEVHQHALLRCITSAVMIYRAMQDAMKVFLRTLPWEGSDVV